MTDQVVSQLIGVFLVFCRIGACFMLLPGLSGDRITPQFRLFLALAISMALAASLGDGVRKVASSQDSTLVLCVASEVLLGVALGFLVRIFYLAMEFAATAMANYAGYGSVFMQALSDDHSSGPFSEFLTLTSIALFFVLDLHVMIISMLYTSYTNWPVGEWVPAARFSTLMAHALQRAFLLTLQLSAPLLVYSLCVNASFGLISKVIPQIPIYLVSVPFVMAGGVFLVFQTAPAIMSTFMEHVADWTGRLGSFGP